MIGIANYSRLLYLFLWDKEQSGYMKQQVAQKDVLGFFHKYGSPTKSTSIGLSPPCAVLLCREIPSYDVCMRKRLKRSHCTH